MKDKLSSNMEDYLEVISFLKKRYGIARVRDIGKFLNVKTSSVTSALNNLSKNGFVVHERYGYVYLTREGEVLARHVQRRHDILIKFLTGVLSINPRIAVEDACKIEHVLSPQTFQKLTKFIEFVEACPDGQRPDWLKNFDYYFKSGNQRKCKMRRMK